MERCAAFSSCAAHEGPSVYQSVFLLFICSFSRALRWTIVRSVTHSLGVRFGVLGIFFKQTRQVLLCCHNSAIKVPKQLSGLTGSAVWMKKGSHAFPQFLLFLSSVTQEWIKRKSRRQFFFCVLYCDAPDLRLAIVKSTENANAVKKKVAKTQSEKTSKTYILNKNKRH